MGWPLDFFSLCTISGGKCSSLTLGREEVLLEYLEYGGGAAHQLLVALPHPVRQAARPVLSIKNVQIMLAGSSKSVQFDTDPDTGLSFTRFPNIK
jgi:hypothetical protein